MNLVWHNNQIIEVDDIWAIQQQYPRDYIYTRNRYKPYGFFSGNGHWIPVDVDKVPIEFRTALLIWGIP